MNTIKFKSSIQDTWLTTKRTSYAFEMLHLPNVLTSHNNRITETSITQMGIHSVIGPNTDTHYGRAFFRLIWQQTEYRFDSKSNGKWYLQFQFGLI